MARKSGLGKGLGALIPAEYSETEDASTGFERVPVSQLTANRRQPRSHFDEESLAGLTASIAELGVLQPILVRPAEDGTFEIIAGERRWRAARRAGLQAVPVVIRQADGDVDLLEQALVENLHRDDLNPLEEASAFQQLIEDFSMTQDQVAQRVGKSRAAVANTLRLFQLPPAVQAMVADNRISAGHARAILGTPDRDRQIALAEQVVADGLSVRQVEAAVKASPGDDEPDEGDPAGEPGQRRPAGTTRDPAVLELEEILAEHLSTRVRVNLGSKKGEVVIEFADLPDLERIYRRMKPA